MKVFQTVVVLALGTLCASAAATEPAGDGQYSPMYRFVQHKDKPNGDIDLQIICETYKHSWQGFHNAKVAFEKDLNVECSWINGSMNECRATAQHPYIDTTLVRNWLLSSTWGWCSW